MKTSGNRLLQLMYLVVYQVFILCAFPREASSQFSFSDEPVRFTNKHDGTNLAGTLCLPEGRGTYPAVVLISGSGPQNRDEEILQHKPFKVIAEYLASRGIATLRYDDRGVGESGGVFELATSEDFARDASAGMAFLKGDKRFSSVGFLGHSEGGMVAPMAQSRGAGADFLISLAGTALPGLQVLQRQQIDIGIASGQDREVATSESDKAMVMFNILLAESDSAEAGRKLESYVKETYADYASLMPDFDAFVSAQVAFVNNRWMRFLLEYDPAQDWKQVLCPVLALNGTLDTQVAHDANLGAIEASLIEAINEDFTIVPLKDHNHLFQICQTGAPAEYASIEESISPQALEIIASWILDRFGK